MKPIVYHGSDNTIEAKYKNIDEYDVIVGPTEDYLGKKIK